MENYKIKRVNEVKKWVDSIKDSRSDFEAAHVLEDELYLKILRGIADGTCEDPQQVAKEAIKTQDINFPRYCA
ncbi:hypothetical protein [uncultured Lactobacillus sp.]|uniref:hypothetical protein n=1 Tax=uncultured Lactobacillus sp. TaxID=153152 RepID=UPI002638C0AA|nr:hypothetical protein [uncultured Lactobacillus sp.]